jgi:cell division protein ZapA (FtsZ GTPase activity inhibitor)
MTTTATEKTYRLYGGYDARETLREIGATFDRTTKAWVLTAEQYAELQQRNRPTYSRRLCNALRNARIEEVSP